MILSHTGTLVLIVLGFISTEHFKLQCVLQRSTFKDLGFFVCLQAGVYVGINGEGEWECM